MILARCATAAEASRTVRTLTAFLVDSHAYLSWWGFGDGRDPEQSRAYLTTLPDQSHATI